MTEGQYRNIYTGRLTEEEMKEFMQKGDYAAIVDATHPYAVVVSSNIRQASAQAGLPYYRLRRTLQSAGDDSDVIYVKSQQECVRALEQTSGNILLTTGSKELHCYCENEALRERLFVRVLPGTESIEICHKNGILGRQIIAMQGPFPRNEPCTSPSVSDPLYGHKRERCVRWIFREDQCREKGRGIGICDRKPGGGERGAKGKPRGNSSGNRTFDR